MEELGAIIVQALSLLLLSPLVDGLRAQAAALAAGYPAPSLLSPLTHLAKVLEKEEILPEACPWPARPLALGALSTALVAGLALPIVLPLSTVGAMGLPALLGGLMASAMLMRMIGADPGPGVTALGGIAMTLVVRAELAGTTNLAHLTLGLCDRWAALVSVPLILAAAMDAPCAWGLPQTPNLSGPSLACIALASGVRRMIVLSLAGAHLAQALGCGTPLGAAVTMLWLAATLGLVDGVGPSLAAPARARLVTVASVVVSVAMLR